MIYESLYILKEQLTNYLKENLIYLPVELENIAYIDSGDDKMERLQEKIIISLLRLEEEKALNNLPHFYRNETKDTEYKKPPISLNQYIIISANINNYIDSLKCISKVIEFFQYKNFFSSEKDTYTTNETIGTGVNFRFEAKLFSPPFEQLNQIWGMLGGKQIPSVFYKISLVQIEQSDKKHTEKPISEPIITSYKHL